MLSGPAPGGYDNLADATLASASTPRAPAPPRCTRAIIWDCNGQSNQRWALNSNGTISGVQSGLCLDAYTWGTTNGTKIVLWTCHGGVNQQFSLRN